MRANAPTAIGPTLFGMLAAAVFAGAFATACGTGNRVDKDPMMKAVLAPVEAAEIAALPDGPGKQIVAERCLLCHGAALMTQQRKDSAAWGRTVTQMRTWGTPIQDDDQAALVAYLTQHYGPPSAKR
jgi:cytochrome c5